MRRVQHGAAPAEHCRSVFPSRFLPNFQLIDHVVDRAQQSDRAQVVIAIPPLGSPCPMVDSGMGKCDQIGFFRDDTSPIGAGGIAVRPFDPSRDIGMRQMMNAGPLIDGNPHDPIGQHRHAVMNRRAEPNRIPTEQANMMFGPIIGPFVVGPQDVYPDSPEIRKTSCQPAARRFCSAHDPRWLP